jgi:hypothetical protein
VLSQTGEYEFFVETHQDNEVVAKLPFLDRPVLVVSIVVAAVVSTLSFLIYFGVVHY